MLAIGFCRSFLLISFTGLGSAVQLQIFGSACADVHFVVTVRTCKLAIDVVLANSPATMVSIPLVSMQSVLACLLVLFCHAV